MQSAGCSKHLLAQTLRHVLLKNALPALITAAPQGM